LTGFDAIRFPSLMPGLVRTASSLTASAIRINSTELIQVSSEDVAEIATVCDDIGLASALMAVTDRLAGCAHIGCPRLQDDGRGFRCQALDDILIVITTRIGQRPEASHGSLELIGRRLLHELEFGAPDIRLYRSPSNG
jgi:hypothetical protein